MSNSDLIIVAVVALLAVLGFFQGFIVGGMSLAGMVIGVVVATRVAPLLLEGGRSSPYASLAGLMGALVLATVLSAGFQDLGEVLRKQIHVTEGVAADRVLGGVLALMLGLGLVWIVSAVLMSMPQLRELRPYVVQSRVVIELNRLLPPSGPLLNSLARYDPFPRFHGPGIVVARPDGNLPKDPQVRAAARSVVRVVGSACGFAITGSGWIAARGIVVTNAHVVAGERDTAVQVQGKWDALDARVVHFDAANDVAVLRVSDLNARALPVRLDPPMGTAGAVLGYPESGPFDSRPARFDDTSRVRSEDIYGSSRAVREVTSFRGLVRHGNSGGPVVDGAGRVLTTVFAATVGGSVRGGYGVPNDIVRDAVIAAGRRSIDTGPCIA